MWMFQISTGHVTRVQGQAVVVGTGYSGHGAGLNNPDMQDAVGVGPLPVGLYTIGAPLDPPDHLGPLAMPLKPDPSNDMHGRGAFFIHGDNLEMNHTASDGCIILAHLLRQQIAASGDTQLKVIA